MSKRILIVAAFVTALVSLAAIQPAAAQTGPVTMVAPGNSAGDSVGDPVMPCTMFEVNSGTQLFAIMQGAAMYQEQYAFLLSMFNSGQTITVRQTGPTQSTCGGATLVTKLSAGTWN